MRTTILSTALMVLIGGAEAFAQGSSSMSKNSGGSGGGGVGAGWDLGRCPGGPPEPKRAL